MGVLEPGIICPTDGYTYIDTPGYFGHIELARPVFYVQHIKEIILSLQPNGTANLEVQVIGLSK